MREKKEIKSLSVCVPKELYEKARYVAAYNCRSVSSMARMAIKEQIAEFERENGKIGL